LFFDLAPVDHVQLRADAADFLGRADVWVTPKGEILLGRGERLSPFITRALANYLRGLMAVRLAGARQRTGAQSEMDRQAADLERRIRRRGV
jgi:hypothetical protein